MKKISDLKLAKAMYEAKINCRKKYYCDGCWAYTGKDCKLKTGKVVPANWDISKSDIERLENEANLEKGIAAIEELAESPEEKVI